MNAKEWEDKCKNEMIRLRQYFGEVPKVTRFGTEFEDSSKYVSYFLPNHEWKYEYYEEPDKEESPQRFDQWLDDI